MNGWVLSVPFLFSSQYTCLWIIFLHMHLNEKKLPQMNQIQNSRSLLHTGIVNMAMDSDLLREMCMMHRAQNEWMWSLWKNRILHEIQTKYEFHSTKVKLSKISIKYSNQTHLEHTQNSLMALLSSSEILILHAQKPYSQHFTQINLPHQCLSPIIGMSGIFLRISENPWISSSWKNLLGHLPISKLPSKIFSFLELLDFEKSLISSCNFFQITKKVWKVSELSWFFKDSLYTTWALYLNFSGMI